MKSTAMALLLACTALSLAACKKSDDSDFLVVPVRAFTDCVAVFDPKLDGSPTATISYAIEPSGCTYTVDVKIMDGPVQVRLLVDDASQPGGRKLSADWDGKNDAGQYVDPGTYDIVIDAQHATTTPITHQAQIDIVRLGVDRMSFGGYAMVYPRRSAGNTTDFAINTPQWVVESLDTATGTPRPETVANQSAMYPDNVGAASYNYPFCYAAGAKPQFTVRMGSQAVSNVTQTTVSTNYPVAGYQIRIEVDGYSTQNAGADDISPADTFTFDADKTLGSGCDAQIISIDFTFSYHDGTQWTAIPGKYSTTHELYRTAGTPRAVDYDGGGTPDGFLYLPLAKWSCTWASGGTNAKQIADGCYLHLEECGLQYMVLAWYTADMLDDGGGMCDGWNDLFDHLLAVHGFETAKYFYGLSANAGSSPELKWASIVIKSPGMNQTEPVFTDFNDYRCVESAYPVPRYYGDTHPGDDVDYYQNTRWYKFSSPAQMDGHCINFLVRSGGIYLYDATFRNTLGPTPMWGTFSSLPPDGYMQGSALAAFKSIYYDKAIDYHQGNVYYDTGTTVSVATLDIRTSLFDADELRLYWLRED